MASLVERLLKSVTSQNYICEEVMRGESTYGAGDMQVCGGQSITYCDNSDCESQRCKQHIIRCLRCGREYCQACAEGHVC